MMLSALPRLSELAIERSGIIADMRALEQHDWGGSIRGQVMDTRMRARLTAIIRSELATRLAVVSQQIRDLGVEIDEMKQATPASVG